MEIRLGTIGSNFIVHNILRHVVKAPDLPTPPPIPAVRKRRKHWQISTALTGSIPIWMPSFLTRK